MIFYSIFFVRKERELILFVTLEVDCIVCCAFDFFPDKDTITWDMKRGEIEKCFRSSISLCCYFLLELITLYYIFFFQAEDGIRVRDVAWIQTCALPICAIQWKKILEFQNDFNKTCQIKSNSIHCNRDNTNYLLVFNFGI